MNTDRKYEIDIANETAKFWSEKVLIVTKDYEIKGYIFMPKTGKKNRMLSDIFNSGKRFISIKQVEILYKNSLSKKTEFQDFIQLKIDEIVFLRLANEC